MKPTTDPFDMADQVWTDTSESNFDKMADRILTVIANLDPPVADKDEFLSRIMEFSWKTGFACALQFMATGAIQSFPIDAGKN